ncbi:hypothetical protein [Embleya hyalina]|uniref:Uncharacterized protein n=1 Tax=Embleya hyalina TaxID=516124 RepID=A0A401YF97_9ACTN|nr:hypothetical protein [Embleya hyalina]GCD93286.1 hypothetical protein EHYA_00929 [Embleya hyalina]
MSRRMCTRTMLVTPIGRLDPVLSTSDRTLLPDAVFPPVAP